MKKQHRSYAPINHGERHINQLRQPIVASLLGCDTGRAGRTDIADPGNVMKMIKRHVQRFFVQAQQLDVRTLT